MRKKWGGGLPFQKKHKHVISRANLLLFAPLVLLYKQESSCQLAWSILRSTSPNNSYHVIDPIYPEYLWFEEETRITHSI
jgi:hypothetical protein